MALAFVPSSLMLGVTTHLTTDIAAIPLLWVMPLALYLLTFILAFARLPAFVASTAGLLAPILVLLLLFQMQSELKPGRTTGQQLLLAIGLHLGVFFVAALLCHLRLAQSRPSTRHLTEFYLWMSVGGVLGGLFNALLAPLLFPGTAEYTLALACVCLLLPRLAPSSDTVVERVLDVGTPVLMGLLALALLLNERRIDRFQDWLDAKFQLEPDSRAHDIVTSSQLTKILLFLPPLIGCYIVAVHRPLRFGLAVAAILTAWTWKAEQDPAVLHRERSFFGILKVELTQERQGGEVDEYIRLLHGTTMHGMQSTDPDRRGEPLTYYHRTGPLGQVMTMLEETRPGRPLALIGLGTGTLASYGHKGQELTFYEIDPAVVRLARDSGYFSYWKDAKARDVQLSVVLGDARLRLREAPSHHYGLIVVDAFSSDAIPIHLLTREALEVYLDKLADDGLLAIHISNRYLDLAPVLHRLAEHLGVAAVGQVDRSDSAPGKSSSDWVVLARKPEHLRPLVYDQRWRILQLKQVAEWWAIATAGPAAPVLALADLQAVRPRWEPLEGRPDVQLWTDDYSNLLSVVMWR